MKNYLLFIALFFTTLIANSQDTLLLKNGNKILCKITKQDSSTVYFDIEKNDQTINTFILKEKLINIKYYNPAHANTKSVVRNSLELSVGISIPMSDYAKDDAANENSGYAGKGLIVNIVYNHHFTKNIGIAVKGNYVNNAFKSDKFFVNISDYIISYNKNYYILYGALAGPTASIYPLKRISLSGQFLMGIGLLIEPVATCTVKTNTETFKISLDQKSSGSLVYNARLGIKYMINDKVDIIANVDYIHGSFNFGNCSLLYLNPSTGDVFQSQKIDRGTQKYDVLNFSIGTSLKF